MSIVQGGHLLQTTVRHQIPGNLIVLFYYHKIRSKTPRLHLLNVTFVQYMLNVIFQVSTCGRPSQVSVHYNNNNISVMKE